MELQSFGRESRHRSAGGRGNGAVGLLDDRVVIAGRVRRSFGNRAANGGNLNVVEIVDAAGGGISG